uniref:Acetyltransferase At3g50280 family n=1 Tax=Cajanus cajan TaxID=3821 RepID=A0A151QQ45_CAJCA|nr:putative acetyltransferase At3g50280 family [Cajanus cajan]
MTISNILSPIDVPPIVHSLFDHHNVVDHDGHTMPLFSVKVTKLLDGLFIGCSMNHAVGDGTSFFNFIKAWFEIINVQCNVKGPLSHVSISHSPIHNRWFPDGCGPFINLPLKEEDMSISISEAPKLRLRIFHFSGESIAKLKAKANEEFKTTEISSFQSLVAHVWRSITRARHLPYDQKTSCKVSIDNRSRMEPPLGQEYFGNAFSKRSAESTAGELLEHDLGWAAWKVHLTIANYNDKVARHLLKEWLQSPVLNALDSAIDPCGVSISSSPRFNPYGQHLGTFKGIAILSGFNNKFDGKVGLYPGYEGGGSIDVELSLSHHAMNALESDEDFMRLVSTKKKILAKSDLKYIG